MRDKEAVEAERKNLARNAEKQAKLIDRLMDTERNLTNQLVGFPFAGRWPMCWPCPQSALDKESVALKKTIDAHRDRITDLERDLGHAQVRADAEKQRMDEVLIKSIYSYLWLTVYVDESVDVKQRTVHWAEKSWTTEGRGWSYTFEEGIRTEIEGSHGALDGFTRRRWEGWAYGMSG